PPNLQARFLSCAQPEMQTQIVLRTETASAPYFLHLAAVGGFEHHARANRSTVRLGADQLHKHPVVGWSRLISEKRRIVVQVADSDTQAARTKDVAVCRPATAARSRKGRTALVRNVGETGAVEIAQQDKLAVSFGELVLQPSAGRINRSACNQNFGPAIIVDI